MSSLFDKVKILLHEKFSFHYDQIQLETKLELELGMDSKEMIDLFNEIEHKFMIKINLDDIDKMTQNGVILTVEELINYIQIKIPD